jgi:RimJ/RimL family protein N-acetyltransferase
MGTAAYRTLIALFDELRGERVIVRPYRESDAQALFEAVTESRDHLRPWLPFADAHQTVEESRDWIIHQLANWLLREDMTVGVWEKANQRYLGGSGLHPRNWQSRYFEIGYWLRASATGQGFMTEAVRLLTAYAFNQLSATRLEIRCDERNGPSAAIARGLGFVQEARLRHDRTAADGTLSNTLIFALLPTDRV